MKVLLIAKTDFINILYNILNSDNNSDNDIFLPLRKCCKLQKIIPMMKIIIIINNLSYGFGKRKLMKIPAIKVATLSQLCKNKKELDFFNIIFDNIFWKNIVTETNQYHGDKANNE